MTTTFLLRFIVVIFIILFSIGLLGFITNFTINVNWWALIIGFIIISYLVYNPYIKGKDMFILSVLKHSNILDKLLRLGEVVIWSLVLVSFIFDVKNALT